MFTLADEEKARKFYEEDLKAEGRAEGEAKGRVEGEEKSLIQSIRALMSSMRWSSTQAMDALQIPAAKRSVYANML